VEIALFSTDFSSEPVIDEEKSRLTGRQEIVPGQKRMSYGGTFKTRGAMPGMELNKHGYNNHLAWRFQVAPDGHIQTLDMHGELHDPDVIWQQRWMHRDGVDQFNRARAAGQKIISDLDDDFWSLGKTNVAFHTTDPVKNPEFNREHYWNNLGASDLITVSTESLRKRVEKLGVPTVILRNTVDMNEWQQNDPTTDGCVSWVGGIQWRAHDLHILRTIGLPQFLEDSGAAFYHGGDSQVPGVDKAWDQIGIDVKKVHCVTAPLTPIWDYPKLWAPINISLIPLEQVAFNHAKSWLKQLESCAAGVPYVVSAKFPEQDMLISEGTAGRVARNDKPSQWQDHLWDLTDPDVRAEEGAINRKIAELHDIKDRWIEWHDAYSQIMTTPTEKEMALTA